MTYRISPTVVLTAVEEAALTLHRSSDGKNHADVVSNTAAIAAIVDDHVSCHCVALDIKADESEKSAALTGLVGKHFIPTHLVLTVTTNVGALNANGTINIGTGADGAQIAAAVALTGLTAVGATRIVPLAAMTQTILGNATLYANVEAADTGAGTLAIDVWVIGRQV
jgi:hypothetical protein